ncbi:MAG: PucR family transcriptional regulator ligand-binding domain-containing protein [Actinomycetota bacterium]|nr:PucR family transcriptional regulator ligand-binding domain-containing protein [Actinomycetota bacterium]
MPITVRDVLQMECLSQARLVAGEKGLDREVYWITVGEEPDLPEWVFGGELILSTLFAVEPGERAEYVRRLSDRGVAGIMIKPERFLGTIPQSVLEAAEREAFPVAEVPIDVLWSRVLAGYYRHLLAEQADLVRVETEMRLRGGFFDELLLGQVSGAEILRRAALLGCDLAGGGVMLVFDVADFEGLATKRRLDELQMQYLKTLFYETVDGAVREVHPNSICIPRSEGISALLGRPVEDCKAVARHVLKRCRERLKGLPVHAGLGEPCEGPDELVRSCREAASALRVGQRLRTASNIDDRIHAFAALGIQRLLFALSQESAGALHGFKERALGPVIAYDEQHGTQLLETLRAYMECDGNAQEVAERLHVHKHTVRYRLRRLTELTGLDVAKFEDATQLYLAVSAADLL